MRTPLANAGHLARLAAVAKFEAQLAALEARCAALDFELQRAQAQSASRRRTQQAAEAERQRAQEVRQARQARLTEGLAVGLFGSAGALFAAVSSHRPRLGLPGLPGRR